MKVKDVMSAEVFVLNPHRTIAEAARYMDRLDIGVIPIVEDGRVVGILTDRDLAVRAIAADRPLQTPVSRIMSQEVKCCHEGDDIETAAELMGELQVRRLPVLDARGRLSGIVALGDLAAHRIPAASALEWISQPQFFTH